MFIKRLPKAGLFLLSVLVLSTGLYVIFDQFLITTGEEIVKAWYFGEVVNLQEGQILPAISKNQNLFEKSPFIRAVVLVDSKDPKRSLFSVGELSESISPNLLEQSIRNPEVLTRFRSGFLVYNIVARLPGHNDLFIVYEITSKFLMWSYLFAVALSILFVLYLIGITVRVTNYERKKREDLRTDLLRRLAHDLNSPLLAISNLSLKIKKNDNEIHLRLEQASDSIRRILSQTDKVDKKLLEETKSSISAIDEDVDLVPLIPILHEFLAQKRGEYSNEGSLKIDLTVSEESLDKFVKINLDDFKRHFSNIIKNAVEATSGRLIREISIVVTTKENNIEIEIIDSGCGIPSEFLPRLGNKGASFGKDGGKGLGLHFAMASVKHWQGDIKINSVEGIGTKIKIELPTFQTPEWYISSIHPKGKEKLVFVDDDISMIDRWKLRFQLPDKDFLSFNSAAQFHRWFDKNGQFEDNLFFIFDYHLDGQNTGLKIIEELGISKESVLVTSAYLDESVLSKAKSLNVKIMPKVLV